MTYHDQDDDDDDTHDRGVSHDRDMPDPSHIDDPEEEGGDEDAAETVPCPYCRKSVYESAEVCAHCGHYISDEDAPATRRPWWIVAGVVVCLLIILLTWFR